MAQQFETIDDYIASFPPEIQEVLRQVRAAIHEAVPGLEEKISYSMPTFTLGGRYVVYFAGWKKHISVYPVPSEEPLAAELTPYLAAKGTLKFPLNQPIPYPLIGRVSAALADQRRDGS